MELREQLARALGNAYALDREIGGAGMSRVFIAEDTRPTNGNRCDDRSVRGPLSSAVRQALEQARVQARLTPL